MALRQAILSLWIPTLVMCGLANATPITNQTVMGKCVTCHSADTISRARLSKGEWEQTVARMVNYGTKLLPEEKKEIVDYLSELLPREPAPPQATQAPALPDLVRDRCTPCHGMELITSSRKTPEAWAFTVNHMRTLTDFALREPREAQDHWSPQSELHPELKQHRDRLQPITAQEGAVIADALARAYPLMPGERQRLEQIEYPELIEQTCAGCHDVAALRAQVRSPEAWRRTVSRMRNRYHGGFESMWWQRNGIHFDPSLDRHDPAMQEKLDEVEEQIVAFLAEEQGDLDSEELRAARAKPFSLEGTWVIHGEDAAGPFSGTITFGPDSGSGAHAATRSVTRPTGGEAEVWHGEARLYGQSLRTRYVWEEPPQHAGIIRKLEGEVTSGPPQEEEDLVVTGSFERVLDHDGDAFAGSFVVRGGPGDGGSETYIRKTDDGPMLLRMIPALLEQGKATTVTLLGADLPETMAPADLELGEGVTVVAVQATRPDRRLVRARLEVAAAAPPGRRGVTLKEAEGEARCFVVGPASVNLRIEHGDLGRTPPNSVPMARLGGYPVTNKLLALDRKRAQNEIVAAREDLARAKSDHAQDMKLLEYKRTLLEDAKAKSDANAIEVLSWEVEDWEGQVARGEVRVRNTQARMDALEVAAGGTNHRRRAIPKLNVRLRAVLYTNGPDGEAGNEDDERIATVPARFRGRAVDVTATRTLKPDGSLDPPRRDANIVNSRTLGPDEGRAITIPGWGTFRYVPNEAKQTSLGSISQDGLVTPGTEEPRLRLRRSWKGLEPDTDYGDPDPAKVFLTNTGDNRGTMLVRAEATVLGQQQTAYTIVVIAPPDWVGSMPFGVGSTENHSRQEQVSLFGSSD